MLVGVWLIFAGADQIEPPSVDCEKKIGLVVPLRAARAAEDATASAIGYEWLGSLLPCVSLGARFLAPIPLDRLSGGVSTR
jgi:hypothetical protein